MGSTALKNLTAFGFGLPNGRSLPAVTRIVLHSVPYKCQNLWFTVT
jgi:hypothetical protein